MHKLAMTPPPKYIGERWRTKDDHGRNIHIYHGRNIHIYHAPLVHAMMHAKGRKSARTKGPKLSPPKLPLPCRRAHLRRITSPPLPRCRTSLRRHIRPCHHTHPCRHPHQPRRPQSRLPAPSSSPLAGEATSERRWAELAEELREMRTRVSVLEKERRELAAPARRQRVPSPTPWCRYLILVAIIIIISPGSDTGFVRLLSI